MPGQNSFREYCLRTVWCVFYENTYTHAPNLVAVFSSKQKAADMISSQSFEGRVWEEEWVIE